MPDVSYDGSSTYVEHTISVKIKIFTAIIVAILIAFIVFHFVVIRNRKYDSNENNVDK